MYTYQDLTAASDLADFAKKVIDAHCQSELYRTAVDADLYDRRRNVTVRQYADLQRRADAAGDGSSRSNMCLTCNHFNLFNTQRASYLLGNGVTFAKKEKVKNDSGLLVSIDTTKRQLGSDFDNQLYRWGRNALIHGVCFGYWDSLRLHVYPVTQFAPLYDEDTGALRAGVRFWSLGDGKPMTAELYTEEGIWDMRSEGAAGSKLRITNENGKPRPYIETVKRTEAGGAVVVGEDNYTTLPVIPMYGSDLRQSTLIGFRESIDAYDLIKSGFANDLNEVASIYWIIQNCGGMTDGDLEKFLKDIREKRIAKADTESFDGTARDALTPYTADVPHQARTAFLSDLEKSMYSDFGAVDVHTVAASSTNDHIEAAFQPLEQQCDLFEVQVIIALQQLLNLIGIDDTPAFQRSSIRNVTEITNAVLSAAQYLDAEAILDHLPFITVDEKEQILQRLDIENAGRLREQGTGIADRQ